MQNFKDLNLLFQHLWQELSTACQTKGHPWQYPTIANSVFWGDRVRAEQRMVVLRRCDDSFFRLFFHTDSRSAKYKQLQANPELSWLFWNPQTGVQMRIQSEVTLHHQNELSEKEWENTPVGSLKVYTQVLPSGAPLCYPEPPHVLEPDKHYTREEVSSGKPFFVLVEAQISSIDWLSLHSSPQQRAFFKRNLRQQEHHPLSWEQNWVHP